MRTVKAICTDIDGTLLNKERQLSERTISVIRSLPKDFPVVLASSRMPSAMRHLQAELGILHHPLICYNGGYVLRYHGDTPEVISSTFISAEHTSKILSLAGGTSIHMSLYQDDEWFAPQFDQWTDREQRITKANATLKNSEEVIERWAQAGTGAHKVMCMGEEREIQHLQKLLHEHLGDQIHVYLSRPTYLELAPRSISKGTAMTLLLEKYYDFPMENVMAFGDNYNDIHMLELSGLGVAVENAREELKSVASEITGKSVDDGVASAIEKYCFPREN